MAQIICEQAEFGYDTGAVLKNINFQISEGDYLCIVGENGSGKSTLIKGLLKLKSPTVGKIIYSDGLKPNEIGYLPQQSQTQKDFPASVFEVVMSGRANCLKNRIFYNRNDKAAVADKMKMMGIENLRNRSFQELSGGQRQRVLLARALCATKKVLLLDEPVAGLDPVVTHELYELIRDINKKYKITVIMVSHDISAAVKYSTHILHLGNGQLFFGKTDEYVDSKVGRHFLSGE